MNIVNMHEAKAHLSRLVDAAANGQPFIITKAGKPLVKVVAIQEPGCELKPVQRTGFMVGEGVLPADFDHFAAEEVLEMFGLND